jgi:superfamily II DNA/RNA helicase
MTKLKPPNMASALLGLSQRVLPGLAIVDSNFSQPTAVLSLALPHRSSGGV